MDDRWACAKCGYERNPAGAARCYSCSAPRSSEGGVSEGVGQQPAAAPPPSPNPPMNIRHCPQCGSGLQLAGMRFCANCGFDLSVLRPPSLPVAPTSPVAPTPPPAPWLGAAQVANPWPSPVAPAPSASIGPIVAGPQELIVAAGCAAGALIATVLPWYSTVLGSASVSGLQFVFPVIAPVVALIAYWKLHANPPESLTRGWMYTLRISLAAGLVIAAWILMAVANSTTTSFGYTYNTSSLAQPSVGIWLFGLACAVGAVFSFKIPYAKSVPKEPQ